MATFYLFMAVLSFFITLGEIQSLNEDQIIRYMIGILSAMLFFAYFANSYIQLLIK